MNKKSFILELPKNLIVLIELELYSIGFTTKEVKIALTNRVCDLLTVIPNIYKILGIK